MAYPTYPGTIERLAPSRSKAEFLERLGLREDHPDHRRLYELMKDEAVQGRQRTSEDTSNLVPQSRDDPNVRPPYASNQISESAMFREIHRIYENASPWTKPMYDQGWFADGPNRDNWIIRWCLWHVFRYRDNRNRHRWSGSSGGTRSNRESGNRPPHVREKVKPAKAGRRSPETRQSSGTGQFYDPVRDQ